MKRKLARIAVLSTLALPGLALAAPCHDVVGTWRFALACVGATRVPPFGTSSFDATISQQQECVFLGSAGTGRHWVGALTGDGNRTVLSDFVGAKMSGELSRRRGGLFTEMTVTYTYPGTAAVGDPPTACTGTATRL